MTNHRHVVTLSDKELAVLREAIDIQFDMQNDICLDDVWVGQETTAVTREEVIKMRQNASKAVSDLLTVHKLKIRLDSM